MERSITLEVSKNALQAHLNHGDSQGDCPPYVEPDPPSDHDSDADSSPEQQRDAQAQKEKQQDRAHKTPDPQHKSEQPEVKNRDETNADAGNRDSNASATNKTGTATKNPDRSGEDQGDRTGQIVVTSSEENPTLEEPRGPQLVYGTVKATVHIFRKSISSRGILDFKIYDAYTNKVLTQEKLPGEFLWYTEWGYYNGDERALNDYHAEIVQYREAPPPPPQDLFIAFTEPIYDQITQKIQSFYSRY